MIGFHQLRVPHQRYTDETMTKVAVKGHAHGTNQHWYKKVDGKWKFAGLAVEIKWGEFDFDKIFESGRETLGESEKKEQMMDEAAVLTGISGGAANLHDSNATDRETKPTSQETAPSTVEEVSHLQNMNGTRDLAESVKTPMVFEDQLQGSTVEAPMVH